MHVVFRFFVRPILWLGGLGLLGGALGCAHRARVRDFQAEIPLPAQYLNQPAAAAVPPRAWWHTFGDSGLNALLDQAFADNWTLQAAQARLLAASAVARQVGAAQWPALALDGQARRTRTPPSPATAPNASATTINQFALGLAASYELDLWGRVAAGRQAAQDDVLAAESDLRIAEITLAAQVVETWIEARLQASLLALYAEQAATSGQFVELLESRFSQGQAPLADVLQQRSQHAAIAALAPEATAQLAAQSHLLATLIGQAPGAAPLPPPPTKLPAPPPLPTVGLPADLLTARPDVRAALHRLAAADRRTAAAIANRLPALRLTASYGYQAPKTSELFDNWIGNLAAGLAAPLFEGGARAAEVARARATATERLAQAATTLLTALREVEDALSRATALAEVVTARARQLELARQTLTETRARYLSGLGDYLPVLTALARRQEVERLYLIDQRRRLSAHVQLYRALGRDIAPPLATAIPTEESQP